MKVVSVLRIETADDSAAVGYGRDWDEACAHGGFDFEPEEFTESVIDVIDDINDTQSHEAAKAICQWHIDHDGELPNFAKHVLNTLINAGCFASAVEYCFTMVWDGGALSIDD